MSLRFAVLLILSLLLFVIPLAVNAAPAHVHVLTIEGAIDAPMAQYIETGLSRAENANASAVIIEMNTPGGLSSATTQIVKAMLSSRVPVIVYVTPTTARAASAGTFITMAANIAVMSPGTRIGSAHPVITSPLQSGEDIMMKKVVNDSVSFIISIAKERGRNAEWAESAVRDAANLTAEDALKKNVIDAMAANRNELLKTIEGRKVTTTAGDITIRLKGAIIEEFPMPWTQAVLHFLTGGTIGVFLLTIAIFGFILELQSPGAILPGVVGTIAFVLFLYSVSELAVNWSGMLLIVLAIVFFILELKLPSHGVLTVGGIVSFFLGSVMVFGSGAPGMAAPIAVIIAATIAVSAFFIFLVGIGISALGKRVITGQEGMIGQIVIARTDIDPTGKVFVEGTWWTAKTDDKPILKGESVRITSMEGLTVTVVKEDNTQEEA